MLEYVVFYALLGVFLGPIASVVVTPIFCILRSVIYVPLIRDDFIEETKRKGNVVEANLVKSYVSHINKKIDNIKMQTEINNGIYKYQLNGRTYTYKIMTAVVVPKTLTLYYI